MGLVPMPFAMTTTSTLVTLRQTQFETYPEWMDLKTLERYACTSERTLREWIHLPIGSLPASQVNGGKLMVKRSEFDRWLEAHRYQPVNSIDADRIAEDIIDQFRKAA